MGLWIIKQQPPSILSESGWEWGSNNSSHFIYFKRDWMRVRYIISSHFIYFKKVCMGVGSNNSSHFIYFKRVWMRLGVEQQPFYLF